MRKDRFFAYFVYFAVNSVSYFGTGFEARYFMPSSFQFASSYEDRGGGGQLHLPPLQCYVGELFIFGKISCAREKRTLRPFDVRRSMLDVLAPPRCAFAPLR